jgi:peroxiredoxin
MRKILFIIVLFVSGIANCTDNSTSDNTSINQGQEAPDFTYTSLENEQITLSDLRGKVVYLFFFGANCPHCKDNGPVTETEIYQAFEDNSQFIALGLDTWNTSAGTVQNFKNTTGISYTLLLNARQSLVDYYGNASDYDRSVVIGKDGTIAYQGTQFVNKDFETVVGIIEEELIK